ncbi:MAG: M64 family metallopeptidase, partial [Bacteroidales bacterium]|nr:M64 family metallopeptidase [Bacteroidales bacterium]
RHESGGHGFAFLADEYSENNSTPPQSHIDEYTSKYEQYGWFANVDFTNDPKKIRWSAFLSDERYKNEVGIFEGAALYNLGAYRPSENSMMKDNAEYFNAPSRWVIYKRIMELSGESHSFQTFLEYDAVNRAAVSEAAAVRPPLKAAANGRSFEHTAPPVVIP